MRFISWNVNGLRAAVGKGFSEYFKEADADIFSLQETKLQAGQIDLETEGYHQYWNYAEKKGYSGVAVFTKQEPLSVAYGIGVEEHDHEGRVITLEFPEFYHVTVYTPNSQQENARLAYRMEWEDAFRAYVSALDAKPCRAAASWLVLPPGAAQRSATRIPGCTSSSAAGAEALGSCA